MMRIRKFIRLSSTDRSLLVKSAFLLGAVRLGLWLVPFQTLRRLLARVTQTAVHVPREAGDSIDSVVQAVSVASRYVPGTGTCLVRAMAAQVLLVRRGHPTCLHIGVARDEQGTLEAHAWVESQDGVVIGDLDDISRFTLLPPLQLVRP